MILFSALFTIFLLKYYQSLIHFLKVYSKSLLISNTEYDPSRNSSSSFDVGADILNLLFLYDSFIFFHVYYMLRFDRATHLSLLFKFIFF